MALTTLLPLRVATGALHATWKGRTATLPGSESYALHGWLAPVIRGSALVAIAAGLLSGARWAAWILRIVLPGIWILRGLIHRVRRVYLDRGRQ